jgi:hypothetical protein
MIRSKSIEEKINLLVNGNPVQVNIFDIKTKNKIVSKEISIAPEFSIFIETPTIKDLLQVKELNKKEILLSSIKKISTRKEIYDVHKYINQEIKDFLDNLPIWVLGEIEKTAHPELYVNVKDKEKESEVSGILTFFTFP